MRVISFLSLFINMYTLNKKSWLSSDLRAKDLLTLDLITFTSVLCLLICHYITLHVVSKNYMPSKFLKNRISLIFKALKSANQNTFSHPLL